MSERDLTLCPQVQAFLQSLDAAVETDCVNQRCTKVKDLLEELFRSDLDLLPECLLEPAEDKYARRLVHRDPAGRYSVVAMIWNVGQGTALHDHAGEWCVECVYRGRIRVTSYDILNDPDDPVVNFREEKTILAGQGEAGALIPPFEYHTICNDLPDRPSITLHVYGHELTWCHIFEPIEGGHRRVRRELSYTA